MKTITLYELLGLIKDNKAPKKIKFRTFILEKREDKIHGSFNYFDEDNMRLFSDGYDFLESLDEKAEILDDEDDLFTVDDIAEEIADVMVMLEQFKLYYEITDEEVQEIMEEKVERQLKRIEEDKPIEKLDIKRSDLRFTDYDFQDKINELVDKVNELEKRGNE